MSQPSAKSIAERIIEFNENDELRQLWGTVGRYEQIDQLSIELAKAYLELEKEHEELKRTKICDSNNLRN